jgi:hypothetical protein
MFGMTSPATTWVQGLHRDIDGLYVSRRSSSRAVGAAGRPIRSKAFRPPQRERWSLARQAVLLGR